MMTRRAFVASGSVATLSACGMNSQAAFPPLPEPENEIFPLLPAHYGAITDEPHPIPAVPEGIVPQRLWRQEVDNPFP